MLHPFRCFPLWEESFTSAKLLNALHSLILLYLGRVREKNDFIWWVNLEGEINLAYLSLFLLHCPQDSQFLMFLHARSFIWTVSALTEGGQSLARWLGGLIWLILMFILWKLSCLQIYTTFCRTIIISNKDDILTFQIPYSIILFLKRFGTQEGGYYLLSPIRLCF